MKLTLKKVLKKKFALSLTQGQSRNFYYNKGMILDYYSAKQLANLAGVSIKTLHLYDEINLLKPKFRTDVQYFI